MAGISVRGTLLLPQNSFQDLAKKGFGLEIGADLRPLPTGFLSAIALINYSGYGEKGSTYESGGENFNQKSKMKMTGGGIGVRIQPPMLPLKPFVEAVGKITSVEQDYDSGENNSDKKVRSKTRFGYQINAGMKYSFVPTVSLEAGGSYSKLANVPLMLDGSEQKIDATTLGLFAGISFALGW
jgi:opacity protein-like surface antigen